MLPGMIYRVRIVVCQVYHEYRPSCARACFHHTDHSLPFDEPVLVRNNKLLSCLSYVTEIDQQVFPSNRTKHLRGFESRW